MVRTIADFADEIARLQAQAGKFRSLASSHRSAGNTLVAEKLIEAAADCEQTAAELQAKIAEERHDQPEMPSRRNQAVHLRRKAAQFRSIAAAAESPASAKLRRLAQELDAQATAIDGARPDHP